MKSGGKDRGEQQFIERFAQPNDRGYHGIFYVGTIAASPPANSTGNPEHPQE